MDNLGAREVDPDATDSEAARPLGLGRDTLPRDAGLADEEEAMGAETFRAFSCGSMILADFVLVVVPVCDALRSLVLEVGICISAVWTTSVCVISTVRLISRAFPLPLCKSGSGGGVGRFSELRASPNGVRLTDTAEAVGAREARDEERGWG